MLSELSHCCTVLRMREKHIEHIFLAKYVVHRCTRETNGVVTANRHHQLPRYCSDAYYTLSKPRMELAWYQIYPCVFNVMHSSLLSFCLCHLALISVDEQYIKKTDGFGRFWKTGPASWLGIRCASSWVSRTYCVSVLMEFVYTC